MPALRMRHALRVVVPAALAALVSFTPLTPSADAAGSHLPPVAVRANHAAKVAIAHRGDPYVYGAAGPNRFDCSGLTMFAYGHSRLHLPRTAAGQYAAVRHIHKRALRRGDLVFFHDSGGHVYHVGMFLFWNRFHRAVIIHAPYPGRRVHREPVWTTSWYAGTRRPAP